jgi:hypothetical protein
MHTQMLRAIRIAPMPRWRPNAAGLSAPYRDFRRPVKSMDPAPRAAFPPVGARAREISWVDRAGRGSSVHDRALCGQSNSHTAATKSSRKAGRVLLGLSDQRCNWPSDLTTCITRSRELGRSSPGSPHPLRAARLIRHLTDTSRTPAPLRSRRDAPNWPGSKGRSTLSSNRGAVVAAARTPAPSYGHMGGQTRQGCTAGDLRCVRGQFSDRRF